MNVVDRFIQEPIDLGTLKSNLIDDIEKIKEAPEIVETGIKIRWDAVQKKFFD